MDRFKQFERFVQNKAESLRKELELSKQAKIVRQVEALANDESFSAGETAVLGGEDVPAVFRETDVSQIGKFDVNGNNLSFTSQQLADLFRALSSKRMASEVSHVSVMHAPLAPCVSSLTSFLTSTKSLTHMRLSHAGLGDDAVVMLVEALAGNFTLRQLNLSHNRIRHSAAAVAQYVAQSPSLQYLDLSYNYLGSVGTSRGFDADGAPKLATTTTGKTTSTPSGLSGIVASIAAKLDSKLGALHSHNTSDADVAEEAILSTRRFTTEIFTSDDVDESCGQPSLEPFYHFVAAVLRPRDNQWVRGSGWAMSLVGIVATHNGISDDTMQRIHSMLAHDSETIAAQAVAALAADVESPDETFVGSALESRLLLHPSAANVHMLLACPHLARIDVSEEQLDLASMPTERDVSGESPTYDDNTVNPATVRSNVRALARRRRCVQQWITSGAAAFLRQGDGCCDVDQDPSVSARSEWKGALHANADCCQTPTRGANPLLVVAKDVRPPVSDSASMTDEYSVGVMPATPACPDVVISISRLEAEWCEERFGMLVPEECCERSDLRVASLAALCAIQRNAELRLLCGEHAAVIASIGSREWQVSSRLVQVEAERDDLSATCAALRATIGELESQLHDVSQRVMHQLRSLAAASQVPAAPGESTRDTNCTDVSATKRCSAWNVNCVAVETELRMADLEVWRRAQMQQHCDRRPPSPSGSGVALACHRSPTVESSGVDLHQPAERRVSAPKLRAEDEVSSDVLSDSSHSFHLVNRADPSFGGMTKEQWQRDSDAAECLACNRTFGVLRRRHHCRRCGLVFCDKCAPKSALHDGKRICTACTGRRGNSIALMSSKSSSS